MTAELYQLRSIQRRVVDIKSLHIVVRMLDSLNGERFIAV